MQLLFWNRLRPIPPSGVNISNDIRRKRGRTIKCRSRLYRLSNVDSLMSLFHLVNLQKLAGRADRESSAGDRDHINSLVMLTIILGVRCFYIYCVQCKGLDFRSFSLHFSIKATHSHCPSGNRPIYFSKPNLDFIWYLSSSFNIKWPPTVWNQTSWRQVTLISSIINRGSITIRTWRTLL